MSELFAESNPISETYFAVYTPRGFFCHVLASSPKEAMRIARAEGHSFPRGSHATRIGRAGYFAALRKAFV